MDKLDSTTAEKEHSLTEISLVEILESAQKSLKEDDLKSAMFYHNLAKISTATTDGDFCSKLVVLSLFSAIYSKLKKEKELISLAKKLFKHIKGTKMPSFAPEILIIFVKILQKAAVVLEEKGDIGHNLFACWFLYTAKDIYDSQALKGEDSLYETITRSFPRVMEKISENVSYFNLA